MSKLKLNITEEEFKKLFETKTRAELINILHVSGYFIDKLANSLGLKKTRGRRLRYVREEE